MAEGTRLLVDALGERSRRAGPAGRRAHLRRQAHAPRIGTSTGRPRRSTSTAGCASAMRGPRTGASGSRSGAPTCPPTGDGPLVPAADGAGRARRGAARGQGADGRRAPGRNGARWRARRSASARDRHSRAAGPRRPRPHRARRRLRQPRSCPSCSTAAASRPRDRHFATELVYGTTRMRRACDFLVDRFLTRELDLRVRNALRLGAYQLHFLRMPPHAAVGETVEVAPKPARGLVNAVLRRVAGAPVDVARRRHPPQLPRLDRRAPVGRPRREDAIGALEVMNTAPPVTERADGYVQDLASQWVAEAVGAHAGGAGRRPLRRAGGQGHGAGGRRRAPSSRPTSARPASASSARTPRTLPVLAADAARPPFAPGVVRPRPGRRPVLRPRDAAPPSGRPLAHRRRVPRAPGGGPARARRRRRRRSCAPAARSSTPCAPSPTPRPPAIDDHLASTSPRARPGGAARRPVGARRAAAPPPAAGRRHRRHVPPPPPRPA